ncbi:hypothetical protein HK101_002779, partial [Irineochytrium annulatum]
MQDEIAGLRAAYVAKEYIRGFLYKIDELGADGRPLGKSGGGGEWVKWWSELHGPVLRMWRVPDHLAAAAYYPSPTTASVLKHEVAEPDAATLEEIKSGTSSPLEINIVDSVLELLPYGYTPTSSNPVDTPLPPVPYDNFIALNTAGSNVYHLALRSSIACNAWAGNIRLSCYESSRLGEHHTLRLLKRPQLAAAWAAFGCAPFKIPGTVGTPAKEIHHEGYMRVRLAYANAWTSMYVVLTNRADPAPGAAASAIGAAMPRDKESGSFRKFLAGRVGGKKRSNQADDDPSSPTTSVPLKRATLSFYETKADHERDRGGARFRFEFVRQVHVDVATAAAAALGPSVLLKVEGTMVVPERDARRSIIKPPGEPRTLASPGTGFAADAGAVEDMFVGGGDGRPRPQHVHLMMPEGHGDAEPLE